MLCMPGSQNDARVNRRDVGRARRTKQTNLHEDGGKTAFFLDLNLRTYWVRYAFRVTIAFKSILQVLRAISRKYELDGTLFTLI